jgi:hypothetical protein
MPYYLFAFAAGHPPAMLAHAHSYPEAKAALAALREAVTCAPALPKALSCAWCSPATRRPRSMC